MRASILLIGYCIYYRYIYRRAEHTATEYGQANWLRPDAVRKSTQRVPIARTGVLCTPQHVQLAADGAVSVYTGWTRYILSQDSVSHQCLGHDDQT